MQLIVVRPVALQIVAALVTLVFGLPLTFAPLRWARLLGWTVPDDTRLVRYFARSLGALLLAVAAYAVHASLHPPLVAGMLWLTAAAMATATVVHVVGAIERSQPRAETFEILGFAGGAVLFAWLAWTA